MTPGIYFDISNEDYHAGDGVSKSQLDMVALSPALLQWQKSAPVDTEKLKALDMGTALHCLLLEPEEFDKRFIVAPQFNLRTNQGKADQEAFLKDVENMGMTVNAADDFTRLHRRRTSAALDYAIAKITHHRGRYLGHHFVSENRQNITVDY